MAKHTIEIKLPDGWRPSPGEQPRICKLGEYRLLDGIAYMEKYYVAAAKYIILERDPYYINTKTIEYRVEVYRQLLLGKKIEYKCDSESPWGSAEIIWSWQYYEYRVAPTGHDDNGSYYEHEGKRVYVPE